MSTDNVKLPTISESEKKINDFKRIKKLRQSKRMATSPGSLKINKSIIPRDKSPEEKEK